MRATKYRAAQGDVDAMPLYSTMFQSSCVRICRKSEKKKLELKYEYKNMKWQRKSGAEPTWKTVTMAHSSESKFFLSGTVSPASVFRLNLQPKMCIPRILRRHEEKIYSVPILVWKTANVMGEGLENIKYHKRMN